MTDRYGHIEALIGQLRALIDDVVSGEIKQRQVVADAAATLSAGDLTELVMGARRIRHRHFGTKLFGEPAWDILLGLHLAHYRDQAISVSAAITFGETPQSTGLRWLAELERAGLIERRDDPDDLRRSFVTLTPDALEQMDAFAHSYATWVATRATMRKL